MTMFDENVSQANILAGIKNAIGVECQNCGEVNPSTAETCESCGTPLEFEEEEEKPVSIVQAEGLAFNIENVEELIEDGMVKVPLEKSVNLATLHGSITGIENGTITLKEYQANVGKVMNVARTGVELFKTDIFKKHIAALPEDQQQMAHRTAELFDQYFAGCKRMLEYKGDTDMTPALEGLDLVEKALAEMDQIQDRAISLAEDFERENPDEDEDEEKVKKTDAKMI